MTTPLTIVNISSPNWSSRDGAKPLWIIVHSTAGGKSAPGIATNVFGEAGGASSHYVIGTDGTIVRCVDEGNAAWANGPITGPAGTGGDGIHHDAWWDNAPHWFNVPNPNPVTISIEHCKPSTNNSDQLTPAQQAASFALIADICKRNGIPMRAADEHGGITGHFSMNPVDRSNCPGPYPWTALWTYLKQQGGTVPTPNVPTGWTDDGTTLLGVAAPDGKRYPVMHGMRSYILAYSGWNPANTAVEAEHSVASLPPDVTSQQCFLYGSLAYNPKRGVYPAPIGAWLIDARTQITALQAQLAATKPANVTAAVAGLHIAQASVADALDKLGAA